jgi:hypothetical protein
MLPAQKESFKSNSLQQIQICRLNNSTAASMLVRSPSIYVLSLNRHVPEQGSSLRARPATVRRTREMFARQHGVRIY